MAEFIMKELLREENPSGEYTITSAAVSYEEEGNPIYPPARAVLRHHSIPEGGHHAHRIQADEFRRADLVIAMDHSNCRILKRILPGEDMGKVHMLMEYTDEGGRNVADPWYTGDFETCYRDIYKGCRGLLAALEG